MQLTLGFRFKKERYPRAQPKLDVRPRMKGRLVVPDVPQIKRELLDKAHRARYTVHSGTTKMYKNLKRNYWWKI